MNLPETPVAVLMCSSEDKPRTYRFFKREKSSMMGMTDALIFQCEGCGATRVWGNENAKWERVPLTRTVQ